MTIREFLRILSEAPDRRWPEGVLHHGVRVLVLLAMAVIVTVLFPVAPLPDFPQLERGMVAEEDVVAEIGFPVYKQEAELARSRQDAAAGVNPIFVYDSTAVDSMTADVNRFFDRVDSVATTAGEPVDVRRGIRDLLAVHGIPPSADDIEMLANPSQRRRLRQTVRNVIQEELPRGIAIPGELEDLDNRQIQIRGMGSDRTVPADSLLTTRDFFERSSHYVPNIREPGYEQLQRLILVRFLVPSIRPDWSATEQERARARAAVKLTKGEVLRGERIITAGDRVTEEQIERLQAYQQALEAQGELEGDRGFRTAGAFLFNLIILGILGTLLYFYRPQVYRDFRHLLVIACLALAVVAVAAIIGRSDGHVALIPIAFPALVVAMLWDGRLAMNLSLILAVLLASQAQFVGVTALLTLVVGGAVASLSVRVVRRRAEIWVFIALIAAAYLGAAVVLGLLRSWTATEILQASGWGTLNAVASAFAAMGFLPLLEGFTRITTDQTLLELADINRPLLRRLSMEAPGTYAHSINVANLAEAAANAIGAHALLTRVGVYYHDVGKVIRPELFIENQHGGRNPHDKLKPATSAAHIRDHIVEGMRLAEEHRLPDSVKAFIAEHHGTQSISFFYDQARDAEPDRDLDPRDFSYPGPRPQTPETAIVMLADSVESAARVLPDPNPENIRELVERIVRGKMDAGQLDETPLTLGEITRIKEQFASVLSGMYHHRIDYPPARDDREREPVSSAGAGVA